MSRQFVLKKFLRQAPNDLICEYLKTMDVGADIDWKLLRSTDVDPILKAIDSSSPETQERVKAAFSEINDLADNSGIVTLIDVGRMLDPSLNLAEELTGMMSNHRRAFWAFLHHRSVFSKARKVDEFSDSRVEVIPTALVLPDSWSWETSIERIRDSVSQFYQYHEGRGEGCEVDYEHIGSKHYWFVYLENYTNIEMGFNESHQLDLLVHRPMFSISYRFDETDSRLEIAGVTQKKRIAELRDIFTRAVFDGELVGTGTSNVFRLGLLLDPGFELEPLPDLGVVGCRLKCMKINAHGRTGLTMTIEAGEQYNRKAFHDSVDSFLKTASISIGNAQVRMIGLQLSLVPESGKTRLRTHSFKVNHPSSTDLKSGWKDDIARECLKRWGIDTNGTDGNSASESASIIQTVIRV